MRDLVARRRDVRRSRRIRAAVSRDDGAAAVEFAIIATLLMLLVFGVIEYGLWIAQYEAYSSAAREGARVAATKSDTSGGATPPCTPNGSFDNNDIICAVKAASQPYTITGTPVANRTCSDSTLGQLVEVSWTQTFNVPNLFFRLPALPTSRTIKGDFRCEAGGPP